MFNFEQQSLHFGVYSEVLFLKKERCNEIDQYIPKLIVKQRHLVANLYIGLYAVNEESWMLSLEAHILSVTL